MCNQRCWAVGCQPSLCIVRGRGWYWFACTLVVVACCSSVAGLLQLQDAGCNLNTTAPWARDPVVTVAVCLWVGRTFLLWVLLWVCMSSETVHHCWWQSTAMGSGTVRCGLTQQRMGYVGTGFDLWCVAEQHVGCCSQTQEHIKTMLDVDGLVCQHCGRPRGWLGGLKLSAVGNMPQNPTWQAAGPLSMSVGRLVCEYTGRFLIRGPPGTRLLVLLMPVVDVCVCWALLSWGMLGMVCISSAHAAAAVTLSEH